MKVFRWDEVGGSAPCRAASSLLSASQGFPLHGHDFPEVFWIGKGTGIHVINGKRLTLGPGMLVMIRAEDQHAFEAHADGMFVSNIAIRPCFLAAVQQRYFRCDDMFWGGIQAPVPKHYALRTEQLRLMNTAYEELSLGNFDEFHTERFLLNFLHTMYRQHRCVIAGYRHKFPDLPDWLAHALADWCQNPDNYFSGTPALARIAGRSPEHVCRVLRACTGRTPTEWLNEARMQYAARQLESTNRKVLDIALDCGFDSLGHFYSVFQRTHGCPPKTYRKAFQPRPI